MRSLGEEKGRRHADEDDGDEGPQTTAKELGIIRS